MNAPEPDKRDAGASEKPEEEFSTPASEQLSSSAGLPPVSQRISAPISVWEAAGIADRYADFAAAPWYRALNRRLVEAINPAADDVIIDLGSGTGNLSRALSEKLGVGGKVIGIESSRAMLEKAASLTASPRVQYLQGQAEQLEELVPQPVNHITAANSIHLFDDMTAVMLAAYQKLPPGGSFSFSSAFTDEATPDNLQFPLSRFIKTLLARVHQEGIVDPITRPKVVRLNNDMVLRQMAVFGFRDLSHELVGTRIPAESLVSFFTLPGIGSALFPSSMDAEQRSALAREVVRGLRITSMSRYWAFFRGVKQQ